ncbi:MAG TPA: aminotransferase class V-fold PLP-dependent enzyme [Wenzhouxiangella sp.]
MSELASKICVLPDLDEFPKGEYIYLDAGSQHPIGTGAKAAVERYLQMRHHQPEAQSFAPTRRAVLEKFAKLVNVTPEELSYIQSTTAGEHMLLHALGFPQCGGHIITDHLHFFGSIPIYEALARQGVQVTWLPVRDGRIELEDLKAAIRPDTRLVALSSVSTFNGFQHDLKAVCDIAHQAGALVYADIIHAAGCVPLDLRSSGVDFAATSSFKWLMGDFGVGFLYVRHDRKCCLKRVQWGYSAVEYMQTHVYPMDPPGESVADYAFSHDVAGLFSLGTTNHSVIAQLDYSLDYIHSLGVPSIQHHAQRLIDILKTELPAMGYPSLTPPEAYSPMAAFLLPNAKQVLKPLLEAHRLRISVSKNHFRVSVSVFNTEDEVHQLLKLMPVQHQGVIKRLRS